MMEEREGELLKILKLRGISLKTYRKVERNIRALGGTEEEIERRTLKNIDNNLVAIKLGESRRKR